MKDYVHQNDLEDKGWKLPAKSKGIKLDEIVDDRITKTTGVAELECIYENGFRDWEPKTIVQKKFPLLVKAYFDEIDDD